MKLFLQAVGSAALALTVLATTGCGTTHPGGTLDSAATRPNFKAPSADGLAADYRITPFDKLDIVVFRVKDLSATNLQVDASGKLLLPLIGAVQASGLTAGELSAEIARRLGARYLQNPQVTVSVADSSSQKVTVEGSVVEAGVYELKGQTTLLQAIAMARGPSRIASLPNVAILRRVNGQRMAAVFDLKMIREGGQEDPEILGNDIVVVGLDRGKAAFRDALTALPVLGIFAPLYANN